MPDWVITDGVQLAGIAVALALMFLSGYSVGRLLESRREPSIRAALQEQIVDDLQDQIQNVIERVIALENKSADPGDQAEN